MRILALQVSNILRAVAVEIRPDGRVVELTGKNRQGKSSILEALWIALGGEKAIPPKPIHDGAEAGQVVVDLGDDDGIKLKVTRRLRAKEGGGVTTSLVVENADGARFREPQSLLNGLVGALTIDPLEFIRMPEKQRFDLLKRFVTDVDLDALATADKADFDRRTEINRRAKQFRAQAEAIEVPAGAPTEHIDDAAVLAALTRAGEHNTGIERERAERERAERVADYAEAEAGNKRRQADELRAEIAALEDAAVKLDKQAVDVRKRLRALPPLPEPLDGEQLRKDVEAARAHNALVDKVVRRQELIAQAELAESESEGLTRAMEVRKEKKKDAVAGAKMPIEGISFGDGMVLFDGFPLSQASGAQQLRFSVAVAAALNPRLRFVRIKDASLLDDDSWAELEKLAADLDLQVFAETVQSHRPTAVVIEDGMVKQPALQAAE